MEGPEVHAAHPHHTGHRLLDIALALAALLVSAVSLWVAVHHGEIMQKLVEANSFPSIEWESTLNPASGEKPLSLSLALSNSGVGPARVQTLELWDGDRALTGPRDLMAAIRRRRGGSVKGFSARVGGGTAVGTLIGAGRSRSILTMTINNGQELLNPMLQAVTALNARICYCSVLDECFIRDSREKVSTPRHVQACPMPKVGYDDSGMAISGLYSEVDSNSSQASLAPQ